MKRLIVAAVAAVSSLALASCVEAAQNTMPAAAAPDHVKIDVTRAQLQLIGQGLMKLPYEQAAPILGDLQKQLNEADKAAAEAAKPKTAEKPKGK